PRGWLRDHEIQGHFMDRDLACGVNTAFSRFEQAPGGVQPARVTSPLAPTAQEPSPFELMTGLEMLGASGRQRIPHGVEIFGNCAGRGINQPRQAKLGDFICKMVPNRGLVGLAPGERGLEEMHERIGLEWLITGLDKSTLLVPAGRDDGLEKCACLASP